MFIIFHFDRFHRLPLSRFQIESVEATAIERWFCGTHDNCVFTFLQTHRIQLNHKNLNRTKNHSLSELINKIKRNKGECNEDNEDDMECIQHSTVAHSRIHSQMFRDEEDRRRTESKTAIHHIVS